MQPVFAYKRLTHKFASGWACLDDDKLVGVMKVTPRRKVIDGNGYDEGGTYVQYGRAPAKVKMPEFMQALHDTMNYTYCKHEYDCCGCPSYHASITHLGSRRVVIRTRVSLNY